MRLRGVVGVVFALALVAARAIAQDAPGSSDPFPAYLWLHGGPERDAGFHAAVRALGLDGVHVGAGGTDAPLAARGLDCYVDQLAGKGVLELRAEQWRPFHDAFLADPEHADHTRPACLADPAVRDALVAKVRAAVERTLPLRPRFASLADEASSTSHVNPADVCGSESWLTGFRAWLAARHPAGIAALSRRWGASLGSFDSVRPWSTARIRARELGGASLPRNLAPWSDRLEFTDELFAATVAAGLDAARDVAPELPCGLFGMQPAAAFGGHDYFRLMPGMGAFEAYDIGGAFDLADSFADPRALRVVTVFPPSAEAPARLTDARIAAALAHGVAATIVWSAGDVFDADCRPTAFGDALARGLRAVEPAAAAFAGTTIDRDPVWIVESRPSVRAWWMWDSAVDGDTWPRRLSSYEAEHSTSMAARQSWLELFQDLGLQARCVDERELAARLERDPPRLLVLPATFALSDEAATAIASWVAAGGRVVADHATGSYDAALVRREGGALDPLFGLSGRSFAASELPVRNARAGRMRLDSGLGIAERGVHGAGGALGEPVGAAETEVQIERVVERGRACYLNLAVCEYRAMRLDPARVDAARDLRQRVRRVLTDAGVAPRVEVRGAGLPTCVERVFLRGADGRRLLAVRLDALAAPELLAQVAERGAVPVTIEFARPVHLVDESTGEDLGTDTRFRRELDPFGALFLSFRGTR